MERIAVDGEIIDNGSRMTARLCIYAGSAKIYIETGGCTYYSRSEFTELIRPHTAMSKLSAMVTIWDKLFMRFISGDLCAGLHTYGVASVYVGNDTVVVGGTSVELQHTAVKLLQSGTEKILLMLGVDLMTDKFMDTLIT